MTQVFHLFVFSARVIVTLQEISFILSTKKTGEKLTNSELADPSSYRRSTNFQRGTFKGAKIQSRSKKIAKIKSRSKF